MEGENDADGSVGQVLVEQARVLCTSQTYQHASLTPVLWEDDLKQTDLENSLLIDPASNNAAAAKEAEAETGGSLQVWG